MPVAAITNIRNFVTLRPPNTGLIIVITQKTYFQSLMGTFNAMFSGGIGSKIHVLATLEEALRLIEQENSSQA